MQCNVIIKVFFVVAVTFLTTGCLTTTQKSVVISTGAGTATGTMVGTFTDDTTMGAALGAGAMGGILVGNRLDKDSKEQIKAAICRQFELEKPKISDSDKQYVKSHTKNRLPKIPPGHQPPAGDCEVLEGYVPSGAWLIRG